MVTTSPFPEENSDSFPDEEDEEGPLNRGRGVAMIITSPFPKEKGDSFAHEEEEEDDVVMATNSSFTEESSQGGNDQAPLVLTLIRRAQ